MSRLCISGSRNFVESNGEDVIMHVEELMTRHLREIKEAINVIHVGDCPTGIDAIIRNHYNEQIRRRINRVLLRVHTADWLEYGDKAGQIRNQVMINRSDLLLAFPMQKSRGTIDTIRRAKTKGIPVYIYQDGHVHLEQN